MRTILFVFCFLCSLKAESQENSTSLFNQLNTNDVIEISYQMQGCFSSKIETITLTKAKEGFQAIMKVSKEQESEPMFLSQDLSPFFTFEEKLSQLDNSVSYCTATQIYTLKINNQVVRTVTDRSCLSMNSFQELKEQLFNK